MNDFSKIKTEHENRIGHKSATCRIKEQDFKCFCCNKIGHKSYECTSKFSADKRFESANNRIPTQHEVNEIERVKVRKVYKQVKINEMKIDELVDRGSELSVMKKSIYNKLALTKLECTNIN